MTGSRKHKCAADGCQVMVSHRMLMCLADWKRVPLDLQQEIWRTYRRADTEGRARLTPQYLEAVRKCQAAVKEVRERERSQVRRNAPPPQLELGGGS